MFRRRQARAAERALTTDRSQGPAKLQVVCAPIDDVPALEVPWRALEVHGSFFQSWDWIGPLLLSLPASARPQLVRLQHSGATVALALLGRARQRRRGWVRTRTLHLNETGSADFDVLTIEHNDMLAMPGHEAAAARALLHVLEQRNDWDELYLGGLGQTAHARWLSAGEDTSLQHRLLWSKQFHFVDLEAVRAAPEGYLGCLSSNTRHQIRRSMKLYGQRGPLTLQRASSADEALHWLQQLAELHQAHWVALGQPGAFGSDFQRRFHTALVRQAWPQGAAEMTRVAAGDHVLGYLYNFNKNGTLHNYQTGFAYEADGRLKPGLVCHALVAEDAARRGLARYDLLMGGGHYKQRLANASDTMVWCVFQQPRLKLAAENLLRRAAERFRPRAAAAPADAQADPAH